MHKRPRRAPVSTELSRPSPARVYDYLLGGVAHYSPDRDFARQLLAACPGLPDAVRENRRFLQRAVRFLIQRGIRQFLDLGAGVPAPGGVHEVARSAAPGSRVVHVDIDGVATAVAEYEFQDEADVAVIEADLREPDTLMRSRALTRLLDLDHPVGVLMLATPHLLHDDDHPAQLIEYYRGWIAPGSYLALSHATDEGADAPQQLREHCADMVTFRDQRQIADLLGKFQLVEPGIVHTGQWRPDPGSGVPARYSGCYAAVGRKTPS